MKKYNKPIIELEDNVITEIICSSGEFVFNKKYFDDNNTDDTWFE